MFGRLPISSADNAGFPFFIYLLYGPGFYSCLTRRAGTGTVFQLLVPVPVLVIVVLVFSSSLTVPVPSVSDPHTSNADPDPGL